MSALNDLVGAVLKLRAIALEDGLDADAVERATVYTERRIRELAILNVPAAKAVWAAFVDGFRAGARVAQGQGR